MLRDKKCSWICTGNTRTWLVARGRWFALWRLATNTPSSVFGNPRTIKPPPPCNPFHQSFAVIKRFLSDFTWPTFSTEPSAHLIMRESVKLLNIAAPGWKSRLFDVDVVDVDTSWSWRDCEVGRWVRRGFYWREEKAFNSWDCRRIERKIPDARKPDVAYW